MKTVQEIYDEYKIMPQLQMHQLRVASVAKIISDNFNGELDKEDIILGCLFHDMGNIIKSDLNYFPEFLEPKGLEYWQEVKNRFIEKYGTDDHVGTELVVKEFGLAEGAVNCFKHMGFHNATKNDLGTSFENKICNYSDMRAAPHGIISMEDRIAEAKKRYAGRKHSITDNFEPLAQSMRNIEKQVFERVSIKPEDISDEKVDAVIEELKKLKV